MMVSMSLTGKHKWLGVAFAAVLAAGCNGSSGDSEQDREPEPPEPRAVIPFNDTGIDFCINAEGTGIACADAALTGQDGHYGRDADAELEKVGGGRAGFDFTKIANDGSELPEDAVPGSGDKDWACTRDNTTGLIWEVKVDDINHLRHKGHTYQFQASLPGDPEPLTVGDAGNTDTCIGLAEEGCNSIAYVAAVNAAGLCGATNWRLPGIHELYGIVDLGSATSPRVDADYFPNLDAKASNIGGEHNNYWSGQVAGMNLFGLLWYVWFMDMDLGRVMSGSPFEGMTDFFLLLVRDADEE